MTVDQIIAEAHIAAYGTPQTAPNFEMVLDYPSMLRWLLIAVLEGEDRDARAERTRVVVARALAARIARIEGGLASNFEDDEHLATTSSSGGGRA